MSLVIFQCDDIHVLEWFSVIYETPRAYSTPKHKSTHMSIYTIHGISYNIKTNYHQHARFSHW